jgi:zinc-binding alcohol dehydrogenase/oxidoreductase
VDVSLGLLVGRGRAGADGVEPEFLAEPFQLRAGHEPIVTVRVKNLLEYDGHSVKAIRIHEDGGPEVLRYEDAPDPAPGAGDVLIELRAASLNHLDLWVRKGLPSVPKPRILGADGAGVVAALGDGVDGLEVGQRVVINPGLERGETIAVVGEHTEGTHAELAVIPATNVHPLVDTLGFEEAAAFPLVFETAYRMLVTRAQLEQDEWVLLWGIGGGVSTACLAIAKALGARALVTSSSDRKLERARELGADAGVNHASGDVAAAVKRVTDGRGVDVVVEHVGEATWKTSLSAVRPGGRVVVCGATSGPNPPAQLHRIWWKQLTILGSTMGTRADFEGAYELVASGRARPVIDTIFPLAETREAHERLEAGEQLGKIVLRIPA